MARVRFGGTSSDVALTVGDLGTLRLATATLTFWSAKTGGTQYTDLQLNGSPVTSINSDASGQIPAFLGPDGITEMWADAGSTRVLIVGNDADATTAKQVSTSASATRAALAPLFVTEGATRWDLTKYGVPTDGTTLADTAFDALLGNMKAGDVLDIPRGAVIKLANRRDVTKAITIDGHGSTITQSSSNGVFRVTSGGSGFTLRNITGVGSSATTFATNGRFVLLDGTLGAYVEDVRLENVVGQNWASGLLWANYARRVTTRDVYTKSCVYHGQMFLSCEDLFIANAMCDTLAGLGGGTNDCYPIAFTRDSSQTIANAPRTQRAVVVGGWARNTPWEALDTHGAVDIKVIDYHSTNTYAGIAFVGSNNPSSVLTYASLNCWAIGCTADSGVTDGSARSGFELQGALGVERATGGFIGCSATGHGLVGNVNGYGGVRLTSTTGATVSNFRAVECTPHGVALGVDNFDAVLTDIVATDPWNSTAASGVVGVAGNNNTFSLANARLRAGTKSASFVNQAGVRANNSSLTGVDMVLAGGNDFSIASAGAIVSMPTGTVKQSFFGTKGSVQTLPAAGSVTASDIRTALINLGLAQ